MTSFKPDKFAATPQERKWKELIARKCKVAPGIIAASTEVLGASGSGEDTALTVLLPGNFFSEDNNALHFFMAGTNANTGSVTARVKIDSTTYASTGTFVPINTTHWFVRGQIIRFDSDTVLSLYESYNDIDGFVFSITPALTTLDLTVSHDLIMTIEGDAANRITFRYASVSLWPGKI